MAASAREEAERALHEAEQKAAAAAATARRLRYSIAIILAAVLVAAIAVWFAFGYQRQSASRAEQLAASSKQALSRNHFTRAQQFLEDDHGHDALAYLAAACRENPKNSVAASRLFALLTQRNWLLPLSDPLRVKATAIEQAFFSPDGRFIVGTTYGSEARAFVWDVATGEPPLDLGPCNSENFISGSRPLLPDARAFSPAGRLLVVHAGTLALWDLTTRPQRLSAAVSDSIITAAQFLPDGESVLTGAEDGTLTFWSARLEKQRTLKVSGKIEAFSRDGTRVLASRGEEKNLTLELLDVPPGGKALRTRARCDKIESFFSADDRLEQIVATSTQPSDGEPKLRKVVLWRPAKKAAPSELTIPLSESVEDACFDSAGRVLAVLSEDSPLERPDQKVASRLRVWVGEKLVATAGHEARRFSTLDRFYPQKVRVSPDGLRIATVGQDKSLRIWDAKTGAALFVPPRGDREFSSVAFSTDSARLLVGSFEGSVQAWDCRPTAVPPYVQPTPAHEALLAPVATYETRAESFDEGSSERLLELSHPQAKRRLYGPEDNLRLEDLIAGKVIREGISASMGGAYFTPSGRTLATIEQKQGDGMLLRFWNATNGVPLGNQLQLLWEPLYPCEKAQIVFSPDESRAATLLCTEEPCLIDVIDVASMVRLIDTIEFPGATGVAFYDGGLRVFVEATDLKQAWEFWLAIDSAPQWLIELAEVVAGKRVNAEGALDDFPIAPEALLALRQDLAKSSEKSRPIEWALWFLADRATRAAYPGSSTSLIEWVEAQIQNGTSATRHEAELRWFGDAAVRQRINAANASRDQDQ